ncbi:MAG: UDP-N-acetylmuramoyl-tripeptide--D-alanyl-D-alanine ligase [Burkholderiales bacterium]|nr:UDP-N-acetylmuramoyl-tripeptide--D-alanyl-D-alanine ligase [Burkholderiales bacterium]
MKLSLAQIANMCGGNLSLASNPDIMIDNVSIDSRNVEDNTLFVALKGEKYDGHDFIAAVLNNGTVAALSSRQLNLPNLIYVSDTILALGLLAHNYRKLFNIPIIAITGSNGKTTVKEMVKNICSKEFGVQNILATAGNFNNHIGMPLTLLRLNKQHKVAIIEMGMNHAGEINYLSKIANPTIAVVNNVMFAHSESFNDLTDIAQAKGEIYAGLIPDGVALINQQSSFAPLWQKQINNVQQVNFGVENTLCYLKFSGEGGALTLATSKGDINCTLKILGEHNKINAVTAAVIALELGCTIESITLGLESYAGYKGRLEQKTAFNGALIIDDSYNANPDSVKAAILAIKNLPKPHWFILADLKEQGKFTTLVHEEVANFASENEIDFLITIGKSSELTHNVFKGQKMHFFNNQDIVEYCKQYLPKNATLLVKGSQSMNLGEVVNQLVQLQR